MKSREFPDNAYCEPPKEYLISSGGSHGSVVRFDYKTKDHSGDDGAVYDKYALVYLPDGYDGNDTAMTAFVREDGSVCHIVEFDPDTGRRLKSRGGQGYGHGPSWTRGQAWGIYGFSLSYLRTKKREYLDTAVKIADRFVSRIPGNSLIPVDFDQPYSPAYEDSTASAIAACGIALI